MARQEGLILLTGPVGNLSFYKTRNGYFVRRKSGVSGERIKSDPAYARTRENIAEFGRASLATKLVRRAFGPWLKFHADTRVTGRLTGTMVKVIKGDAVSPRGQRTVGDGDSTLLQRFEFNKHCKLSESFFATITTSIDRTTGTMTVKIPALIPSNMVNAPRAATHVRLQAVGAALDFQRNEYSTDTSGSVDIPINDDIHGPLQLSLHVAPASANPLLLVFTVEFVQQVNSEMYPLNGTGSRSMTIMKVDSGKRTTVTEVRSIQRRRASELLRQPRRRIRPYTTPRLPAEDDQRIQDRPSFVQNPRYDSG